ncbi:MAG: bifunctional pyr operon transcriptional regulator/uracil phosphoribosyltransferase PyrR [Actinomycetota bacterium]|nr:bifunctional pyr operon transcriptional regulator/uracil phosphoribosyltransferase PyrR [Actinomycetota bacterium]
MEEKAHILGKNDIERIVSRISHEILEKNRGPENLIFIGLQKRGVPLSGRIAGNIEKFEGIKIKTGKLDITFYRDDIGHNIKPVSQITDISFDIEGKNIILVDDVLYTGRTIRAAMDALIDFGRPKSIQLIVLIDRGHRELPIRADYVGKNLPTSRSESVEVKLRETDGVEDSVTVVKKEE